MKITALGHACFLFETKNGTRIVIDPFEPSVGYDEPCVAADIVCASHGHYDHGNVTAPVGAKHVFTQSVDTQVEDVHIYTIPTFHDEEKGALRGTNLLFVFEADGVRVAHLGDLGHQLNAEQIERLGCLDAVLIPVGGTFTVDAQGAKAVCDSICVKKILPMHYQSAKLTLGKTLGSLEDFTSQFENVTYADGPIEIEGGGDFGVIVPKLP